MHIDTRCISSHGLSSRLLSKYENNYISNIITSHEETSKKIILFIKYTHSLQFDYFVISKIWTLLRELCKFYLIFFFNIKKMYCCKLA